MNGIGFLASCESSFSRRGSADVDVPDTLDADVICFPLRLASNLGLPGACHKYKLEQLGVFFVWFLLCPPPAPRPVPSFSIS